MILTNNICIIKAQEHLHHTTLLGPQVILTLLKHHLLITIFRTIGIVVGVLFVAI